MTEKLYSVSEALALLRGSLAGLGLEHTGVTIACHGVTREKSALIARKLVAGGFGREVKPADRSVRYETRDGWFSWDTVEDGNDMINLFYSLDEDDQPIDYLIEKPEESQADKQGSGEESEQETGQEKNKRDSQEVPGYRDGDNPLRNNQEFGQVHEPATVQEAGRWKSKVGHRENSDSSQLKVRRRLF